MSAEVIIEEWKKGVFKPVYWLEGEEPYFIDKIMHHAEHNILSEAEAGFNLTTFYGRDADWPAVINACRRYPMFAERQVVLLKEAQLMRDVDKLEGYVSNPLPSTVFVVSYKDKKIDGRTAFSRTLKKKGVMLTTKKLYENQLPDWVQGMVKAKGYDITQQALRLLVDNIGNDLTRLENEVEKVWLNLSDTHLIDGDAIEKYVGISKEFNVFELQDAVSKRDLPKAIRIIQYFESNPKAGPVQMVLPTIYNFFSKLYIIYGLGSKDERSVASALGVNPFFAKDYIAAAKSYDYRGVEKVLLLLHEYNLRSIGVNDAGTSDGDLMKEMVVKMMA
ncbi:DNA polymerase III subunit delta [Segetibacter sp. 3557_3]|uniref:DNA polymerase III subunit delta n=1 Tax=Segetibacter sp. 3557_3 TaxID=2547429 RepID=UPI0010590AAF|nr:DNA polymerase III subunit delta [Segetibacter sp. 3557_3]TDH26867.1 DNA polymerase III subunit delta [Segetibacter sp. 3557_3]